MCDRASSLDCPVWYRFSGAIVASHLPGIGIGDPFDGMFRYAPCIRPLEVRETEACYTDPEGLIDATVAGARVQSSGAVHIQLFSTGAVSQFALSATPFGQGRTKIGAFRVLLLTGRAIPATEPLPVALDADTFDLRSFTLEDASFTSFAIGNIGRLSRVRAAA